ncbi:uncharacterized protein LOC132786121 [Drosophila nasuta]|uniref:uncharacterized protein LOC132786121 n=1 Tax=Drosophila nasuta TaxID=42062 RepID=UPI00295E3CD0|nr:uncharacterized protein LOC132786121 [Drosophila nasuta]
MADVLKCSGDAVKAAVEYLQAIKIVEIRQTLELLGVQHIEVIAALLLFVMLQFTKFTAVLLLACSIAYGIFYMWDTWFPEIKENSSATTQNADYGYLYGAPFWGSYGPSYGPGNLSRNSISSGINSNYDNTYVAALAASNRDARTSALFPPFSNSEIAETLPGDHMYDTEEKRINLTPYFVPRPDPFNQKKQNPSGTNTPVGQRHSTSEPRPQRRLPAQTSEENRHNRRDPLAFRRLIANDYRMYRPSTSADAQQYYSYSIPVPEERARRLPGFFDDYKMKYRRSNDKRSSTQRNASHANEQPWNRQNGRSVSRDNLLHRSRNIQEGFPNQYGSPQGRSNAGNHYNPDSSRKKVRK